MTDVYYDPLKRDTLIGALDPFRGSYSQTNRMKAYCIVIVDGIDITSKIEPHLISVRIVDGDQFQCEIEIDDRDAKLPIPPILAQVEVHLGWERESMYKMFNGQIMDFEHGFGRKQGGRRMWVHANGTNTLSTKMKQPMQDNMGEGAPPGQKEGKAVGLTDWFQKVFKNGGVTGSVSGADAKRDHWSMFNASPMHTIVQLAEEHGLMHQFSGGNHVKIEPPGMRGVSCHAVWRDNLIGWRVRPFAARSAWKGSMNDVFDAKAGKWDKMVMDKVKSAVGGPGDQAAATGGSPGAANSDSAAQGQNEGAVQAMDSAYPGHGRIVINGEPRAVWNSMVVLEGARPGVDGTYLIWTAEHIYSRQGYVTWLDVVPFYKAEGRLNVYYGWLPRPQPNF
jgi:uncharacterized protein